MNSPISEISQELLSYILDIVRNEFEGDTDEDREKRLRVVTTASQVSSFWRFVSLDHPLWWTELTIYPTWNLAAIDAHLKQSQQCPLDIRISRTTPFYRRLLCYTTPLPPSERDCLDLLELIFPHLHRCRILQIDGIFKHGTKNLFNYLERLFSTPLLALDRLTLDVALDKYQSQLDCGRRLLFTSAPLLQDLRLFGVEMKYISLPSTTLTSLHLSRGSHSSIISYVDLAKELEACENLTELAIYNDVLNMLELYPRYPTCRISSLRTLLLLGNMDMVSELLVTLDTPNLEELVIAPAAGRRDLELYQNMNDGPAMVKPHFPSLRRLTVAPLAPEEFTEVIENASAAFPLIEHLTIANIYLEEFRDAFTSYTFFAKLVDLALTDVDMTFSDAILAVGKYRLENRVPLKNLILDSSSFKILSQHPPLLEEPYFKLKEGNLWETRRKILLNSEVKDLYTGVPR